MKKNIFKQIFAFAFAMCLLASTIGVSFESKAEGTTVTKFEDSVYADWEQVTYETWGIEDGTYQRSEINDIIVYRGYEGSLEGKVFNGDIRFDGSTKPEEYVALLYVGAEAAWSGMCFASHGNDGTITADIGGQRYTFTAEVAGVKLVDNLFNLKLTYDVKDDALQLGVWFNDVLYNNEYITVTTFGEVSTYEEYLTGKLAIMCTGDADLTVVSPEIVEAVEEPVNTFNVWYVAIPVVVVIAAIVLVIVMKRKKTDVK